MNVRLMAGARVEFLDALVYLEEQGEGLGRAFAMEFHEAIQKIKDNPSSCPRHLAGTRRCRLKLFKYGIVYRTLVREIRVIAVMHLHRRPGYWKGRD